MKSNYYHYQRWYILITTSLFVGFLVFAFGRIDPTSADNNNVANCTTPPIATDRRFLAIYLLAYDNLPDHPAPLAAKYTETVQTIIAATASNQSAEAVILADLGEYGDTHILMVREGNVTPLNCLPDVTGVLTDTITEYDMTDGESLGGFLLWARNTQTVSQTMVSYIGHGSPVAPYTVPGIAEIIKKREGARALDPLPTKLEGNPSFTDDHAPMTDTIGMITPHALQTALKIATKDGDSPIDLLDLLHCFAASYDELYEVSHGANGRLYARGTIASPNYAFFDPAMPGAALAALANQTELVGQLSAVVNTYHGFHPTVGHPHLIAGFDNTQWMGVKKSWENVTALLNQEFSADATRTINYLKTAYQQSQKFDTTYCEETSDWQLSVPDGLSNMSQFAERLARLYANVNPSLSASAQATMAGLKSATVVQQVQDDYPYFAPSEFWKQSGYPGVSLFTPFETMMISGTTYLPWQTLWYTNSLSLTISNLFLDNPYPFQTVQGEQGWAQLLRGYWEKNSIRPGEDVETIFCSAELIDFERGSADLSIDLQTPPRGVVGETIDYTITVTNQREITATGVMVTQTLPAGVTFGSTSETSCYPLATANIVVCNVGILAPHQTHRWVIRGKVGSDEPSITTAVTATTATLDPILFNNSAEATTKISSVPLNVNLYSAEVISLPLWQGVGMIGVGCFLTLSLLRKSRE